MYRHDRVAAHAHIECHRANVVELTARLEASERERAETAATLDPLREGIGNDPGLPDDLRYQRTIHGLRSSALVGLLAVVAVLVPLFLRMFAEPLLGWQGVVNLAYHFQQGDGFFGLASAGAIVALGSPWLALPWVGAIGLRRQRRWGWVISVVSALLYLPTLLMPVSVYALMILWSGRVRQVYFPSGAAI